VVHVLSGWRRRAQQRRDGSCWHAAGRLLMLDTSSSWCRAALTPWLIYVAVSLLLYVVGDSGGPRALLALSTVVTFVTIVATNGHRLDDHNRSVYVTLDSAYLENWHIAISQDDAERVCQVYRLSGILDFNMKF